MARPRGTLTREQDYRSGNQPHRQSTAPALQPERLIRWHHPRLAEELAQALYEASDPGGIPWVRRGRIVREAWLEAARLKLAAPDNSPKI